MNKVWYVTDSQGEWSQIIMAETRHEAIYASDGYQNEGVYIDIRVRRKKEWDQYAALGYVPKEVLLKDGWWFECYGINEQGRRCCAHLTEEEKPLIEDESIYCDEKCLERIASQSAKVS